MTNFIAYVEQKEALKLYEDFVLPLLSESELDEMLQEYEEELTEDGEKKEHGFEYGGKKYSFAFGKYFCNGQQIDRNLYMKASKDYKDSKKVGYKEKTAQDVKASREKTQKTSANVSVAKNDIISKLKKFSDTYSGPKAIERVEEKYKALAYHANSVKLLKQYIDNPDKMDEKGKKFIEGELKKIGTKNSPKKLLAKFQDNMQDAKKGFDIELSRAEKDYNRLKNEED